MSPEWPPILAVLLLILLANGLPALLGLVLGPARPMDGGRTWADGRRLLGRSKTWRGLAVSVGGTSLASFALGLGWGLGFVLALGAMLGDLTSSFLKRRLGRPSGASVPALDQIPEALIPGLLTKTELGLAWIDLGILVAAFTALDLLLTPLGRQLLKVRPGSKP